jgi:hypothetical protein
MDGPIKAGLAEKARRHVRRPDTPVSATHQ